MKVIIPCDAGRLLELHHLFDPISGQRRSIVAARELMKAQIARWIIDFHIDGIRMDSVNNIMNYDSVQQFKDYAREVCRQRWSQANSSTKGAEERFLVVGEELCEPLALLQQNRLDGLWNEHFKRILCNVILGKNDDQEPSFEWSVRKLIDCRLLGFTDGPRRSTTPAATTLADFETNDFTTFLTTMESS